MVVDLTGSSQITSGSLFTENRGFKRGSRKNQRFPGTLSARKIITKIAYMFHSDIYAYFSAENNYCNVLIEHSCHE